MCVFYRTQKLLSEHLEALKRSALNLHRGEKTFLKNKLITGESKKYLKLRMRISERYEERIICKTKSVARLPKPTKKIKNEMQDRAGWQHKKNGDCDTSIWHFPLVNVQGAFSCPQHSPRSFLLLNNSPGSIKSVLSDPVLSITGSAQAAPLEPSPWTQSTLAVALGAKIEARHEWEVFEALGSSRDNCSLAEGILKHERTSRGL